MRFICSEHETFYEDCLKKSNKADCYHKALFYVLGLTEGCRNNVDCLYDWDDCCVKDHFGGKGCGWITGTDSRIIRLAYNLFNGGAPTAFDLKDRKEREEELMTYLPSSIFGGLGSELVEFCFEGIRIRYEMA